jgi:peptide deformylase
MVVDTLPDKIVLYPAPVLRKTCEPFETVDSSVTALAQRMLELMKSSSGVGLAGPQVGIAKCIFVANPTGEPEDDRVYINPELADLTGAVEADEGCLSLPEITVSVRRARTATIRALDAEGKPFEESGEDLVARIWQHEYDHLLGSLIIDRMNAADKVANKRQIAQLEADYRKKSK